MFGGFYLDGLKKSPFSRRKRKKTSTRRAGMSKKKIQTKSNNRGRTIKIRKK